MPFADLCMGGQSLLVCTAFAPSGIWQAVYLWLAAVLMWR